MMLMMMTMKKSCTVRINNKLVTTYTCENDAFFKEILLTTV